MPRYLKLLLWMLSSAVLLCIVAVIAISIMNWNWAKPWVNRQLSELAHRPVQIDGDVRIDWQRQNTYDGWRGLIPWPVVYAQDVTVANPEWATTGPIMARAQSVRLRLDLPGLMKNVVHLADLEVQDGYVVLERRADGANNWTFGERERTEEGSGWQFEVERLMLNDTSLRVLDAGRELDVVLTINTSDAPDSQNHETQWSVKGHYQGVTVNGEGEMGQVLALQHEADPFPVRGFLGVGATTLKAEGTVTRPRDLAGLDVQLELSGPTMADLYPVLGLALPNTPPYQTAGRLVGDLDAEQTTWIYQDFTGTVGKSDLSGTLSYQRREPRPFLTGNLHSELVRFEDLGPLIGAPTSDDINNGADESDEPNGTDESDESNGTGESNESDGSDGSDGSEEPASTDTSDDTGSAKPASESIRNSDSAEAVRHNSEGQLTESLKQPDNKALPVQSADSDLWSLMDADVTFVGKRIESNADLPLDDVEVHVILDDSVLRFEPLDFGVAGGTLESTIVLDGNTEPIQVTLDARARGLQLGKLFPGVESMDAALGSVHGDASLTGRGNSVSTLMEHASGDLSAVVTKGTVSQFLLEAAGLNVANMVLVKIFGDEQVVLQCLVAEFHIDDGLMNTRAFVLETEDAVVTVDGNINLASEQMDLDIHPENKSLRIFTLRSPLYVAGTFKEPDIGVQKGPVAARAGAAMALGMVATPLAALLPLLNVGTDDETTCAVASSSDSGGSASGEGSENGQLEGSVPGARADQPVEP